MQPCLCRSTHPDSPVKRLHFQLLISPYSQGPERRAQPPAGSQHRPCAVGSEWCSGPWIRWLHWAGGGQSECGHRRLPSTWWAQSGLSPWGWSPSPFWAAVDGGGRGHCLSHPTHSATHRVTTLPKNKQIRETVVAPDHAAAGMQILAKGGVGPVPGLGEMNQRQGTPSRWHTRSG